MAVLTRNARRLTQAVLLCACACGTGGGEGGGDSALPLSPAGVHTPLRDPNGSTPAREPVVLSNAAADLTDPCPVLTEHGLWIYVSRAQDGVRDIARAHVVALGETPTALERVFLGADTWEAGAVSAPSVVRAGDTWLLAYEGADGGVGLASSPDGVSFARITNAPIAPGRAPSLLVVGDALWLYTGGPDGVSRATSTIGDPSSWSIEPGLVLEPGAGGAFDAAWVGDVHAVGGMTATGDTWVGLYYGARAEPGAPGAIGFAASRDGRMFTRAGDEPILDLSNGAEDPGGWIEPVRATVLYVVESGMRSAIAAAVRE